MSTTDVQALVDAFGDEVVTHALVRDVELPNGAGTMALVTLDNGHDHTRPTTLGPRGLLELQGALRELRERAGRAEIAAVGVTGKPFVFAVGADLTGVPRITRRDDALAIGALGHDTFSLLADLGVPSFAFVNGAALGGGVEAALHCTYRTVASDVATIALPECFLGLVPGWGGCRLVPELVGIEHALTLVVANPLAQNRMTRAPVAHAMGLFDEILAPADFLAESIRWAARVVRGDVVVQRAGHRDTEADWAGAIETARGDVEAKTGGLAPAPRRALDLLAAARTATRAQGFAAENEALADLLVGDELRAGLYAFDLVQKRARRPAGAPDKTLARQVTKVGVVGAGLMASQLALLFVRRLEVPVVLTDLDEERVAQGVARVHAEIDALVGKGRLSSDAGSRYRALVTGGTDHALFEGADVVVEAVFEDLDVKKRVFAQVEAVVSSECILATNTSSLSITRMAADLAHPERVVGFHFFNPVAVMPLLEIVRGERTDDATLATAFATGKKLKKTCILVRDSPSFVVNRLLGRFMSEVGAIVDAGTPIEVADAAFAGVTPMPPFHLIGLVGPAIALHNNETLASTFPDRFDVSTGLRAVVEAGHRGYYVPGADGEPVVDEAARALHPRPADPVSLSSGQVRDAVLAALAQEARIMLDEGVVAAPMDLDLAMIAGAGFPFWNGGLTPLLDRTGVADRAAGGRFLPPGVAGRPA